MLNIGIIVIVLAASSNGVLGILTETPQNTAILLYSKLQLNCSSDQSPTDDFGWAKRRQNGTFEILGSCETGSSGDYDFVASEPNSCHLVVFSATTAQDGIFRCVTFSESAVYASVSIIGEEPKIASVEDLNNVTVGQKISLSCNVSYLGNIVPLVNWIVPPNVRMTDVQRVDTQGVVMTSVIVTSDVEGQYSIRIKVSFDSSSINIDGLDPSLAVYVSTQPLELYFMSLPPATTPYNHVSTPSVSDDDYDPPTNSSPSPICTGSCLDAGEIAGIVVGCVVGAVVIVLVIILFVVKC